MWVVEVEELSKAGGHRRAYGFLKIFPLANEPTP